MAGGARRVALPAARQRQVLLNPRVVAVGGQRGGPVSDRATEILPQTRRQAEQVANQSWALSGLRSE